MVFWWGNLSIFATKVDELRHEVDKRTLHFG
jgi:hypothetical protein